VWRLPTQDRDIGTADTRQRFETEIIRVNSTYDLISTKESFTPPLIFSDPSIGLPLSLQRSMHEDYPPLDVLQVPIMQKYVKDEQDRSS
jgi:hypothetical protein